MIGLVFALFVGSAVAGTYPLATDHSGTTFFDGWILNNTYDSLTNGDVVYVNYSYASTHNMAVIENGQAIIAVDNFTEVIYNYKRDSVKMTTAEQYGMNSVFVMDATHLPYGCSVWPSFWTQGADWPLGGEMDIMEAVNLQTANSYALHTSANSGCIASSAYTMTGSISGGQDNCSTTATQTSGCVIQEPQANSYGAGFAANGGGVYAAELTADGVYMWFFERAAIPAALTSNATTIDTSTWGTPSANYSSAGTCNIGNEFGFQSVILDITLCGDFALAPSVYNATCSATRPGTCYAANVYGPNSAAHYSEAFFAINYVRIYSSNVTMLANTASANSSGEGAVTGTASSASAAISPALAAVTGSTTTTTKSGASQVLTSLPLMAGILGLGLFATFA